MPGLRSLSRPVPVGVMSPREVLRAPSQRAISSSAAVGTTPTATEGHGL